ncbi:hypothetical protein JOB18_001749 [Solea senegalensis]|uniref:Interferon gamma n=1 Tax=Solea senegalensis TaxID=28829 RepID=A0AAV6QPZ5_SOLSE|nr:hypothetical protein JOB18_001749 [Solea senegalensis]
MSLRCGTLGLLVLLGLALALGSPHRIKPSGEKQPSESTTNLLHLKEPEVGKESLFKSVVRGINTSCQRKEDIQVMNATLSVYMRIFSSILHHHHSRGAAALLDTLSASDQHQVKLEVKVLQQKMEKLWRNLSVENHNTENLLRELSNIQVDDQVNQRRALAEFQMVYQAASLIMDTPTNSDQ